MTWDSLKSLILYASKIPLPNLIQKILYTISERRQIARYVSQACQNQWQSITEWSLKLGHFVYSDISLSLEEKAALEFLVDHYLEHRFDVLGSGWVLNAYGVSALGMEGHIYSPEIKISDFDQDGKWLTHVVTNIHLKDAQDAWRVLRSLHADYLPIDWQRDIKSGFRWNAKLPFNLQMRLYQNKPGVDVKVAWDLSHFVHLPQMALAARQNLANAPRLVAEIQCQILDFIATNPVGMGVNFAYSLEVGFRSANWLVALDLLDGIDSIQLNDDFRRILTTYLSRSLHHMLENLEYREGLYSNHYLGDIIGLLFLALYLDSNHRNQVLYFGISELLDCISKQYFEDGGFFEGSTSYHRFATEMTYYGLAIIRGLPTELLETLSEANLRQWPYPIKIKKKTCIAPGLIEYIESTFGDKLRRAAQLSLDLTHDGHKAPQFGDNDCARFLAIIPKGDFLSDAEKQEYINLNKYWERYELSHPYWKQDHISHGHVIAMAYQLFNEKAFKEIYEAYTLDAFLIRVLSRNNSFQVSPKKLDRDHRENIKLVNFKYKSKYSFKPVSGGEDLDKKTEVLVYPEMEIFILRSDRFFMAISGLSNHRMLHRWTHVHNDALGVELYIDGQAILKDPGTYCYTALPERRKYFRSTSAHNVPMIGTEEQNRDLGGSLGLFNLRREARIQLVHADENRLTVSLKYRRNHIIRDVQICADAIQITDYADEVLQSVYHSEALISDAYGYLKNWKAAIAPVEVSGG